MTNSADYAVAAYGKESDLEVKALIFDMLETVVDRRGSIIKEGSAWGKTKSINVDWARFADRWRSGYAPAIDPARRGKLPWTKLEDLHRIPLESLPKELMIEELSEEERPRRCLWCHQLQSVPTDPMA